MKNQQLILGVLALLVLLYLCSHMKENFILTGETQPLQAYQYQRHVDADPTTALIFANKQFPVMEDPMNRPCWEQPTTLLRRTIEQDIPCGSPFPQPYSKWL